MLDSGAALDLVGRAYVESFQHSRASVSSAGAAADRRRTTHGGSRCSYVREDLSLPIQSWVLVDSPAVLSLGKRCMEDGCSFHCPAGKLPSLVGPDGESVPLVVRQNVPYVQALVLAAPAPTLIVSRDIDR